MDRINNILVPIDFSDASKSALRYACGLAETLGASLHVLHSVEIWAAPAHYVNAYVPDPAAEERLEEDARRLLQASLPDAERAKLRAVLVERRGDPAREILAYLREQGSIDLIVMATHGRGGVARLMMGSVADKVVREATCPVLTLRAPHHVTKGAAA